ncbi:MAG TPA: O-antigen ligase family protein [Chloroflexia bacterium]
MQVRTLRPPPAILDPGVTRVFALVTVLAGLLVGFAAGLGMPQNLLIALSLSPFLLIFIYARPHWAVTLYVVLVYADLLSIMVKYHDFPPLARFAGAIMLSAVLGYRVIYRREGLKKDEVTAWLVAYGAVIALGLLYARNPDLVMPNLVEFIRNFLTYLIIINSLTNLGRLKATLWGLLGIATLLSLLTIYQTATGSTGTDFGGLAQFRVSEIFGGSDAPRPGGTIGDANYYGQLLLIVVPVGLYFVFESRALLVKLIALGATTVVIGAIVFTYSRGDAVALGVTLFAVMLFKRPKLPALIALLVGGMLVLLALPSNYVERMSTLVGTITGDQRAILTEASIRGRVGAVSAAVDMFADHMVLGVGRENYPLHQLEYLEGSGLALHRKAIPPHDLYLEIATEHGIVGLLVFGGLILACVRALREARRRFMDVLNRQGGELAVWLGIGLLGYLVSSVFLHGAFLYMLWLQVALMVALRQISRNTEVERVPAGVPPDEQEPVLPFADPTAPRAYLLPVPLDRLTPPSSAALPGEPVLPVVVFSPEAPGELIRRFYEAQGGEDVFGKAVSTVFEEQGTGGRTVPVQYYEFARLECHPVDGGPYEVVIGKVGLEVEVAGKPADLLPPALQGEQVHIESSAITVPSAFYEAWQTGGADLFGYPVSPVLLDTSSAGLPVYVQYFERARLEYHPHSAGTGYEVQLTPIGLQLYNNRYGVIS